MRAETRRPGWPTRRSGTIRAKTVVAASLVFAIALALTAWLFLAVMRRALNNNVANSARARAEELALLTQETKLPSMLPDSGEKGSVVQVVDGAGRSLAASAQVIAGRRLSRLRPGLAEFRSETRDDLPITGDQEGDPFRVVAFGAQTSRGPIFVYVGVGLDQVNETVAAVRKILLSTFPGLFLIVALTSWRLVGKSLRPVDAMLKEIAEIGDDDLSRRIPEPSSNDEIGRLARGMNLMLARLQSSTQRQQRFVADASHELQSPLAASLADLEVALAYPGSTVWSELATSLVTDNQRMTKLVGDLLFLARSDAGMNRSAFVDVDLDDIVREEARRFQSRVPVRIDLVGVRPAQVRGNPEQLVRMIRNLVDNATRYAASLVSIDLHLDGATAVLRVADDGPGVPEGDHGRIFERFSRLDDSRSRQSGGSGLGLAIVKEIVETHAGTVTVEHGKGARFVVRLPLTG